MVPPSPGFFINGADIVLWVFVRLDQARVDSVDFPALGTGIFQWPDNVGTREIAVAVVRWLGANAHSCVKRVCFTDIDAEKVRLFKEAVEDAAAPGAGAGGDTRTAAPAVGGAGASWSCGSCTFINPSSAVTCEICGGPRA